MPSRQPRWPSIGFVSRSDFDDARELRRARCRASRASSLRLLAAVREELVQRRIEQPDRHREPVHRLEDALEVGALHRAAASPARGGVRLRRARRSSRASRGCGRPRRTCARCGTARCLRRRSPARCARRCGVSAFARTRERARLVRPAEQAGEWPDTSAPRDAAHGPGRHAHDLARDGRAGRRGRRGRSRRRA